MSPRDRPSRRSGRGLRTTMSCAVLAGVMSTIAVTSTAAEASPQAPRRTGSFDGVLDDGATWTIDVPTDWNGTLLLYGHGLVPPGEANPAEVAPDPGTREHLLDRGIALAGSSYATTGWAVEDA